MKNDKKRTGCAVLQPRSVPQEVWGGCGQRVVPRLVNRRWRIISPITSFTSSIVTPSGASASARALRVRASLWPFLHRRLHSSTTRCFLVISPPFQRFPPCLSVWGQPAGFHFETPAKYSCFIGEVLPIRFS